MRVLVLGAGRVGGAMAVDLAGDEEFDVTAADSSPRAVENVARRCGARTVTADLSDTARMRELIRGHDLVVGALPSRLGYAMLRTAVEAGVHVVDISFFLEDTSELEREARERGVVAVMDAGVSPGLSSLLLGDVQRRADRVDRYVCYVGGLPEVRTFPWEYKAPFSPFDVIELYTRPARYREEGEERVAPALSELEHVEVPGIGLLEAFLTDGLRGLLRERDVPFMREMTLRYPGHAAKIALLRDAGFFGLSPLVFGDCVVSPRDVTARLLFPMWEFARGERDVTVLRVEVDAVHGDERRHHHFELIDRSDEATGTSSMARTTGYTCTAIARLIARGTFHRPGLWAPEAVGREAGCCEQVLADLSARGVNVSVRVD